MNIFYLLGLRLIQGTSAASPMVNLEGIENPSGVTSYLGIRYGRADRFKLPKVEFPREGIYDTTGDICPQPELPEEAIEAGVKYEFQSEDCLFLNIHVPPYYNPDERFPVYIYIHGGSFVTDAGSNELYNGAALAAEQNVVVVTFNYRLGILGTFYDQDNLDKHTTINYGIADQKLALRWIHYYIGYFQGDGSNMVLYGQSAGAMSVGIHAQDDDEKPFNRAIMQSNPLGVTYKDLESARFLQESVQNYVDRTEYFLDKDMKTMDYKDIIKIQDFYTTAPEVLLWLEFSKPRLSGFLLWAPVVDLISLKSQPKDMDLNESPELEIFHGFNRDEANTFVSMMDILAIGPFGYKLLLDIIYGVEAAGELLDIFDIHNGDRMDHIKVLRDIMNATLFYCSSRSVAQNIAHEYTFRGLYEFNISPSYDIWPSYYNTGFYSGCLGTEASANYDQKNKVCHEAEVPLLFNNAFNAVSGPISFTEQDKIIGKRMRDVWFNADIILNNYSVEKDNLNLITLDDENNFNIASINHWDQAYYNHNCDVITEIMNKIY